jgi:predicted tellurium resistance membrane protein TerC
MEAEVLISLFTLIALEVVLGIDNIIFISILSDKLPHNERKKARYIGLGLALVMRLLLLASISWILKLDQNLFAVASHNFTGKEIILILGGFFLIYKSSKEIFDKTEHHNTPETSTKPSRFNQIIGQILLLDLVFSVDSIITAIGLVDLLWVMYAAVIVSMIIMLLVATPISSFVERHPSIKVLALCFLMMIGLTLMAEGFEFHIPKGYVYVSMIFSLIVNMIQINKAKV